MSYLLVRPVKGGDIKLYPQHVAVAHVTNKQIYFYSIFGVKLQRGMSLKKVKEWLAEHGIKFFHIAKNKIACEPHVLGALHDNSIVYNPAFHLALNEEAKTMFSIHSMNEYYRSKMRKGSHDYLDAKAKADKSKGAKGNKEGVKNDTSGHENDTSRHKNDTSGRRNDTSRRKKI